MLVSLLALDHAGLISGRFVHSKSMGASLDLFVLGCLLNLFIVGGRPGTCAVLVSVDALVTRPGVGASGPMPADSPLLAMLRSLLPLRSALRHSARPFHPLAGQSLTELQEKWPKPPSANLVPIVIEQTVFSRSSHPTNSHTSTRGGESVRMTFSPASYEKES